MARGAAEFCGEKRLHKIPRDFRADSAPTHAKDVHVIILDTLLRREMIVNETGADTSHFVRANRCADATATNRQTAIHLANHHRSREGNDEIRIVVVGRQRVRAEVHELVPGGTDAGDQFFL